MDLLTKATCDAARVYVFDTTQLAAQAARLAHTSHLASAVLARALTSALLFAALSKDEQRVTFAINGSGPIGRVFAEAAGGSVRGYVTNPDVFLPLVAGKLDERGACGRGEIAVTRYAAGASPYTGYVELADEDLAAALTRYFALSEETPASVALGVTIAPEGTVLSCGAWFVQALPGADAELLEQLAANVERTPYLTQLLALGYSTEKIAGLLCRDLAYKLEETTPLRYHCPCSRSSLLRLLLTLPPADLALLAEDSVTEAHCQFCNKSYHFSQAVLQKLLAKKRSAMERAH